MTIVGTGLLVTALALLAIFRPGSTGEPHPRVQGVVISALFPTLILGCITFGIAILLSQFLD